MGTGMQGLDPCGRRREVRGSRPFIAHHGTWRSLGLVIRKRQKRRKRRCESCPVKDDDRTTLLGLDI